MEKMKLDIQLFGLTVTLTSSATSSTDQTAISTNQNSINLAIRVQTTKPTWNGQKTAYYQVTTTSQNNGTQTGSKYYFSIGSSSGSGDKTFNVLLGPFDHNPNGTLNDVSISVYVKITDSTHTTKTQSVVMGTIPRASEITSVSSGTTGYSPTIVWTPLSSSFKYKVRYTGYDSSQSVLSGLISPNQTTPYSYNGLYITNTNMFYGCPSSSITATATLYTYQSDGTTLVGQKTKTFSVNLDANAKPTLTITNIAEADPTMQTANWGIYVQNHSKLTFKATTGAYALAAPSVSTTITTNDQTFTQNGYVSTTFTTNVLSGTGTKGINGSAIDIRNRGASPNPIPTYNVVAYSNPTISVAQVQRCDVNGNIDNNGSYVYISYGGSISSCSNKNTPSAVYKVGYRVHNTGDYQYIPLTTNANSYSASGMLYTDGIYPANRGSGTKLQLSTSNTYDIQFYVKDYFTNSTNVQVLTSGFDLMNFNANGKAMAIGKVSEASADESKLEIGMNTRVDGTFTTNTWATNNTVDTWVPVWRDGYLEHRVIPATYNTTTPTLNSIKMPKNGSQGSGIANTDNVSILRNWSNNDVALDATGNGLFLGYQNTTLINLMNGKGIFYSDGSLKTGASYLRIITADNTQNRCYKLCNIPASSNGNAIQVNIKGQIGNWTTNKATIDLQISNRQSLNVYGTLYGNSDAFTNQTIVIYQESNGSHSVYLKNVSGYTSGSAMEITWCAFNEYPTIYDNTAVTSSPSGTLVWTSSTSNVLSLSPITGTSGLSKSSGSSTLQNVEWIKIGRVVNLKAVVKTTAQVNSGSDIMTGTITDSKLTPYISETDGLGYFGGRCVAFRLRSNGTFTIRNAGYASSGIASGENVGVSITYISAS